jgi:shikimate kinase
MPAQSPSIMLIGYRATGKSTMGVRLAQTLGFSFIDTDQTIEQQEGQCIRDMVEQHGWDYFRQAGHKILFVASNLLLGFRFYHTVPSIFLL